MSHGHADATRAVIICDHDGNPVGTANVLDVHQGSGILHKAFSVFVFRSAGAELLLQQRSQHKRLFPLRWANTCCSHAAPSDAVLISAAGRRLQEEFGFSVGLREAGAFVYRAEDPLTQLTEYEHDTVLVGHANGALAPRPDPSEIAAWQWMPVAALQGALRDDADTYAPWLAPALRIAVTQAAAG